MMLDMADNLVGICGMAVGKNICSTSSTFDAYDQTLQLGTYMIGIVALT